MGDLIAVRDWLTIFQLPPLCPLKLNVVEEIWPVLKQSPANLARHDITQLTTLTRTGL